MLERKEYEITKERALQLKEEIYKDPFVNTVVRPFGKPMINYTVDDAWSKLGQELGFDFNTVESLPNKGECFFTAIPYTK